MKNKRFRIFVQIRNISLHSNCKYPLTMFGLDDKCSSDTLIQIVCSREITVKNENNEQKKRKMNE